MTFNVEGSDYYVLALKLKKEFEDRWSKTVRDDDSEAYTDYHKTPTLMDKKMFSQNIYNINSEDLGKLVVMLDQRCDACIKKIEPDDLEIDIDAIDNATFWVVDNFVKNSLPGNKKGGFKSAKVVNARPPTTGPASKKPKV
jgi:Bromodomain extra-terminal - transcription regulation